MEKEVKESLGRDQEREEDKDPCEKYVYNPVTRSKYRVHTRSTSEETKKRIKGLWQPPKKKKKKEPSLWDLL